MPKFVKKEEHKIIYPSQYGSHRSMVDEEATKKLSKKGKVICVDEHGPYETDEIRLDSGFSDPNRYAAKRLKIN